MILDGMVVPMELAHLPYRRGKTFEQYVSAPGLKRLGKTRWREHVIDVVGWLTAHSSPNMSSWGGGNAKKLGKKLPP
jgi:polyphosphate glucokinase